jgi:hypothetical protein
MTRMGGKFREKKRDPLIAIRGRGRTELRAPGQPRVRVGHGLFHLAPRAGSPGMRWARRASQAGAPDRRRERPRDRVSKSPTRTALAAAALDTRSRAAVARPINVE